MKRVMCFLVLWSFVSGVAAQQTCNSNIPATTPSEVFVDQGDGTVTDTRTGLMWKRCAEGQTWADATCSGDAGGYTWSAALTAAKVATTAGHGDWRLPNVKELNSLVEERCYAPAINTAVFPGAPSASFWSGSPYAGDADGAWSVYFSYGFAYYDTRVNAYYVRLVRGGQSFDAFDATDTRTLTVNKTGAGSVKGDIAIDCGASCSAALGRGWPITLTASLAGNLLAWGGACSGSASSCVVTMDADKTVTASFLSTPLVAGLPESLPDFGWRNVGSTSAAQSLTLSNTGTERLNIAGIVASSDFAVSHNCGAGLAVGGSCTVDVTFTPTAKGVRNGTLTVTSNAPGSPQTVALSGGGVGALAQLSTSSLMFGAWPQGTLSAPQLVTLFNFGGLPLHISGLTASDGFVQMTSCSVVAPGGACTINVAYAPATVGAHFGTLMVASDSDNGLPPVMLYGSGLAAPMATLDHNALSFVEQRVGTTSAAQTVQLSNDGAEALTLDSIVASGDFAVSHNCGSGLGVGGFCDLLVTFVPTAAGARTGAVTIVSNAPSSPATLSLSGTAISQYAPLCTLSAMPQRVGRGRPAVLTANCNPAASTYTWMGGTCVGTTTASCTVHPNKTTAYSVTGTNSFGTNTAQASVRVSSGVVPILNILMD